MKLNRQHLSELQGLIRTLRSETVPVVGHSDPNAINDCWNTLIEITDALALEVNRSWDYQTHMSEVLNNEDGVYRP